MPESKRLLKVFLCHASVDKPKVRELYRYLRRRGVQPWFDEEDLIGGQDWQVEIPKALATSDAIIICLTKNAVDKEGYIQKEIKFALDKALEMPEGRIFLIPVKFEECEVPFSLNRYQWVDLTIDSGYPKMMKALKFRASQLERATVQVPKPDESSPNLASTPTNNISVKVEGNIQDSTIIVGDKNAVQLSEEATHEKAQSEAVEKAAQEKEKQEREAAEKIARENSKWEVTENKAAVKEDTEYKETEKQVSKAKEKLISTKEKQDIDEKNQVLRDASYIVETMSAQTPEQVETSKNESKDSKSSLGSPTFLGLLLFVVAAAIIGLFAFNNNGTPQVPVPTSTNESLLLSTQSANLPTILPSLSPTASSSQIDGSLAAIKQRGYILVSTDPNYKPQSFLNANGVRSPNTKCPTDALSINEMQGFDVDVAHKIGDLLGVETCFITPSWDAIKAGGWADKWDISVGSMIITVEQQKVLNFSVPYYYTPAVIAVNKDSGIKSLNDLSGKVLCAGASTTYEAWIKNDMIALGLPASSIFVKPPSGLKVISLNTDGDCAQALATGQKDFVGYMTSKAVIDANISAGLPVVKLGSPIFVESMAVSVDKSSSLSTVSLLNEINKIITAMHQDGTLSALSVKWFGIDLTQN